eukprot:scaffold105751_cov33-Phaeocystis_antarctica.AAC.2
MILPGFRIVDVQSNVDNLVLETSSRCPTCLAGTDSRVAQSRSAGHKLLLQSSAAASPGGARGRRRYRYMQIHTVMHAAPPIPDTGYGP